jgi:hypothetical protein
MEGSPFLVRAHRACAIGSVSQNRRSVRGLIGLLKSAALRVKLLLTVGVADVADFGADSRQGSLLSADSRRELRKAWRISHSVRSSPVSIEVARRATRVDARGAQLEALFTAARGAPLFMLVEPKQFDCWLNYRPSHDQRRSRYRPGLLPGRHLLCT